MLKSHVTIRNWYNPVTKEMLHPDLKHPAPIGPHWDYTDASGIEY